MTPTRNVRARYTCAANPLRAADCASAYPPDDADPPILSDVLLMTGGVLAQLFEEAAQRVQFFAKAGPVAGFQLLEGVVVVAERLTRSIGLGAGDCGFDRRSRTRGGRGGSVEERGQCPGEGLVHDHTVAIGGDHPLQLEAQDRQMAVLDTQELQLRDDAKAKQAALGPNPGMETLALRCRPQSVATLAAILGA